MQIITRIPKVKMFSKVLSFYIKRIYHETYDGIKVTSESRARCLVNNIILFGSRCKRTYCIHITHVDLSSTKLTLSAAGNQCPLTRKCSLKTKPFVCPWAKGMSSGSAKNDDECAAKWSQLALWRRWSWICPFFPQEEKDE